MFFTFYNLLFFYYFLKKSFKILNINIILINYQYFLVFYIFK